MAESLRILILEDNPTDAELVQFELQEAGLIFTAKVVMTEKDFVRKLQEFSPALILSDYDLPEYNGALALAEARKRCPDTPFILVTGAVSEDRAIEILTQGAKDYVLKSRLQQRLVPAVRRALAEAEEQKARKKAEEELREAHRTLESQIEERTAELKKQIEHRSRIEASLLKYNERLEVLSYTASQLLESDKPQQLVEDLCRKVMKFLDCDVFFNFIVDDSAGRLHLNACAGIGPETAREIEWLNFGVAVCGCVAQGGCRIVAENIPATPDVRTELIKSFGIKAYACHPLMQQNKVIGTLSFGTRTRINFSDDDLAVMKVVADQVAIAMARVRSEEKLRQITERFEMAQKTAEVGTWDWNVVTGHIEWSKQMFNLFGLDPQETPASFESWTSIMHPEDADVARLRIDEVLRQKITLNSDYRIVLPDGQIRWINAVGEGKYDDQGRPIRMIGICMDITGRKMAESQVISTLESIQDGFFSVDEDWRFIYVNAVAEKVLDIRRADVLGKSHWEIFPLALDTKLEIEYRRAAAGEVRDFENYFEPWSRWFHNTCYPRSGGGMSVYFRDITERKKMEDLMRESETRFRTMANSIPQLAWIARADGFIFWYNQRWYDYTGTTPEQMEGWGWQSVHDPKILPEVMERWKTAIATGEPFDMEFPLLGADKIFRPFLTWIQPLKNEQGRVIQWFGTNTDLSKRKQAEEELALNEREFRLLAESMPQIVWTTRVDGWNTYFNQKWVDYTGLTLEESYGHGWNKPFHPDDQQRAWDAWQNAVLHNTPYLLQCRLRRADGIYRWWLIHGVPVLDENGNIIKWYGTCTDINDLKQTEEAMLQSQNQFNLLIENIRSGVALIDDTGKFTVVNPSFLRMFGLKDDETINNVNDRNWNDWQVFESDGTLLHIDEHPVRKAAITGKPVKNKLVGVRLPSGGDLIWMLISADLVLRPNGSIQSTICTYYDITERKRAEQALRENELFLGETENVARLGGWKANPESNFLMWTEGVYRIVEAPLDYNPDLIEGLKFYIPKYRPILHERLLHTLATNEPFAEECEIITMSGRHVWVEVRGLSSEREGAATYVMGTIQDISDRRIRENEREKYNHALRALSRSSQVMMRSTDEYKYMEEICKIIVEDCGYTMVWIGFAQDDESKTVRPVTFSGFEEGYIESLKITWADTERGRGPTGTAIRTGKPATCRNILTDPRFEPWRKEAIKRGYASSIVLPLMAGDKAFGALTIYSKEPDSFAEYEEKLLAELANDLSYGITAIRLREALKESEERFHAIATNTPDHIMVQDSGLRYQLVINPQLGLNEADMLGKTDYDILDPRDADKLTTIKRKVMETGEAVSLEPSVLNSRGEPEFFEGAYVPKIVRAGKAEGIIGYFRNVTQRKRTEEAILRAKDEWERTFDTVPDLIAILDKEHRVVRVNKAMAQRLKLAPDQCIGVRCYEVVHGLSCPPEFCPHSQTCLDGREHKAEVHEAILGGDFLVSTTPLCDPEGQLVGSVHVARDITGRKTAEDQLAKQAAQLQERKAELEEINSELESFSYSISHDLRAPLRAIDGFSRIILRQQGDQFDEKTKRQFNMIRDNIKLMGVLIEDILSFSRVQKTSMSISVINMDKLAREVWKEIKAANKKQKIEFKIKKIKPGYGDHALIRQVLFNLFSNAVKFTKNKKQGVIEMSSDTDDGKTVYCIKDNGAVFDMAHYDKLFGVFQRLHSSEEYEGTGIGLAIVHRIVSRHGGRVWAESELEKGATFCFTLNSIPSEDAPERRRKNKNS